MKDGLIVEHICVGIRFTLTACYFLTVCGAWKHFLRVPLCIAWYCTKIRTYVSAEEHYPAIKVGFVVIVYMGPIHKTVLRNVFFNPFMNGNLIWG